jgi:hypothetical protein
MAVSIKFMQGAGPDSFDYEDRNGFVYRYQLREGGALAVYETAEGEFAPIESVVVAVYGPASWFNVAGIPWGN